MIEIVQKDKLNYIIPLLLLAISYIIFALNLEGQAYHFDERRVIRGGEFFFELLKNGEFLHPCFNGLDICEYSLGGHGWEWPTHSSFVRHFFSGLSEQIFKGGDDCFTIIFCRKKSF